VIGDDSVDAEVEEIASDIRRAGFDVGVSPRIQRDKWLKLFLNLASTAHASPTNTGVDDPENQEPAIIVTPRR